MSRRDPYRRAILAPRIRPAIKPHRFQVDADLSRGALLPICRRCPLPEANDIHTREDEHEVAAQAAAAAELEARRLGERDG